MLGMAVAVELLGGAHPTRVGSHCSPMNAGSLVKLGLMSMLFGKSAVLTPNPVALGPGTITLPARQPMSPVSDSMQVFVGLGEPTEEERTKVTYGQFGPQDVGDLRVRICEVNRQCLPMKYGGAYVAASEYGLTYTLTSPSIRKARFAAVKIETAKSVPHATVKLQNYLQKSGAR